MIVDNEFESAIRVDISKLHRLRDESGNALILRYEDFNRSTISELVVSEFSQAFHVRRFCHSESKLDIKLH